MGRKRVTKKQKERNLEKRRRRSQNCAEEYTEICEFGEKRLKTLQKKLP